MSTATAPAIPAIAADERPPAGPSAEAQRIAQLETAHLALTARNRILTAALDLGTQAIEIAAETVWKTDEETAHTLNELAQACRNIIARPAPSPADAPAASATSEAP